LFLHARRRDPMGASSSSQNFNYESHLFADTKQYTIEVGFGGRPCLDKL